MDFVIIFKDRTNLMISRETHDIIQAEKKKGRIDEIVISGSTYKYNSFDKILTQDAFFAQYPTQRPEVRPLFQLPARETYQTIEQRALNDKARSSSLIRGLAAFIDGQKQAGLPYANAQLILDGWKSTSTVSKEDKIKSHWKAIVEKYTATPPKNQSEKDHQAFAVEKLKTL